MVLSHGTAAVLIIARVGARVEGGGSFLPPFPEQRGKGSGGLTGSGIPGMVSAMAYAERFALAAGGW